METLIHKFGDMTLAITGPASAIAAFRPGTPIPGKVGEHKLYAPEVADLLGISRQLVHYRAKRGLIPTPTIGANHRPYWNAALMSAFVAAIGGAA